MEKLEIESADEAQALFALLDSEDKQRVRSVLRHIDSASLMPEQSLLIQLAILDRLRQGVEAGRPVAEQIGDSEAYASAAIAELGEDIRQTRHIGALMGGIAICAIILLGLSLYSLIRSLIAGTPVAAASVSFNIAHVICFIAVLAGTRIFVIGDKKASYNDPKKARNRTQIVGFLFIIAFVALVAACMADLTTVLAAPALLTLVLSLVLLLAWKLSGRL